MYSILSADYTCDLLVLETLQHAHETGVGFIQRCLFVSGHFPI